MRLLPRVRLTEFTDPRTGKLAHLRHPDAPATSRQLQRLNRAGLLALVEPGQVEPVTQAEAAYAVGMFAGDDASTDLPSAGGG